MTARSPSAFLLSAALHAVIVALLLLIGYSSSRSAKDPEKIFQLVAGEGDNYAATVAPALGTPGGAKADAAPLAQPPKAEPVKQTAPTAPPKAPEKAVTDLAKQVRRSVIKAESKAKQQVAKERAAEEKRQAEAKKKQELQAKAEAAAAAAQSKAKSAPPTKSKSPPPKIAKIDTEGIVKGVLGGSTENTKGGAGGKALATDNENVVGAYFAMFKQRVRENFEPPGGLSDSLHGEFQFRIHPNGSISNARVLKSSGSSEFDRAVLEAIRQVKMPPHPYSRMETVEIQFTMREPDTG